MTLDATLRYYTLRSWVLGAPLALGIACTEPAPEDEATGGQSGTAGSRSENGGSAANGLGGALQAGSSSGGTPNVAGTTTASGGSLSAGGRSGGAGGAAGAAGSRAPSGGDAGTTGAAGADSGGSTGATSGSGGDGSAAAAGTGSGGQGPVTFQTPEGTIPNEPQPASSVDLDRDDWQDGLVSPSLLDGKGLAQPSVVNGYLMISGNEEFWLYDVSNPAAPALLSEMKTPNAAGGEAESHTISYARYGDKFYMVTLSGTGIDSWDVTNARAPQHLSQLKIAGTNYGDYTEAVWGVTWQGQYIYVGATNNGIKIVDAANPAALTLAGEVSTSQYGGVSAGPLEAVGNVLVVMTPKESGGVATLDISDPLKPARLASFSAEKSYIGQFFGHSVFLITPVRSWDVLTNPRSIGTGSTPLDTLATEGSEYMSFSDNVMFLGHVRTEIDGAPGASKIPVADPRNLQVTDRIWGRMDRDGKNDDQFTIPIGNLLVLADDQLPYAGWVIAVHQAEPDTIAPVVDSIVPKDASTGVSIKSRIGISFTDNIELATVNAASFIVRPVGGEPLPGKFGIRMSVLNFDPDVELTAGTTYEVVLPQGGVADLVGNTLATEWKSTFTTN